MKIKWSADGWVAGHGALRHEMENLEAPKSFIILRISQICSSFI